METVMIHNTCSRQQIDGNTYVCSHVRKAEYEACQIQRMLHGHMMYTLSDDKQHAKMSALCTDWNQNNIPCHSERCML